MAIGYRERMVHKTLLALLITGALGALAAASAWAAAPRKGATYKGTSSQDRAVTARVTNDGKGLQLRLNQRFSCNRGPAKTSETVFNQQRPTIRADGTFSYTKIYPDLGPIPGFEEVHTDRQRVTGSFVDGGRRVRGKITVSSTGQSGLTCRSSVTFTARAR